MTDQRFFQLEVSYALAILLSIIINGVLLISLVKSIDKLQSQQCYQPATKQPVEGDE